MKKPVVSGPWSVAFDADAFGFNCHRRGMGASVDGEKGRMIRRKGRVELPDGVGAREIKAIQGYSRFRRNHINRTMPLLRSLDLVFTDLLQICRAYGAGTRTT